MTNNPDATIPQIELERRILWDVLKQDEDLEKQALVLVTALAPHENAADLVTVERLIENLIDYLEQHHAFGSYAADEAGATHVLHELKGYLNDRQ